MYEKKVVNKSAPGRTTHRIKVIDKVKHISGRRLVANESDSKLMFIDQPIISLTKIDHVYLFQMCFMVSIFGWHWHYIHGILFKIDCWLFLFFQKNYSPMTNGCHNQGFLRSLNDVLLWICVFRMVRIVYPFVNILLFWLQFFLVLLLFLFEHAFY